MTDIFGQASHNLNFTAPSGDNPAGINIHGVLSNRLDIADPNSAAEDLARIVSGVPPTIFDGDSDFGIAEIVQLGELSGDSTLPGPERLGALVVLSCLASAYTPEVQSDKRRDVFSAASFSVLLNLAKRPDTKQGRFAGSVLNQLTEYREYFPEELLNGSSLILQDAALPRRQQAQSQERPTENGEIRTVAAVSPASLTEVAKLPWIDAKAISDPYYAEEIVSEGHTVALLCNLTSFNRRTEELAQDVADHGQSKQAWRYAIMGVRGLTQGKIQPSLDDAALPVYLSGNRRCSNERLVRTYYSLIGHQDGIPIYGVLAQARTRANQKKFLQLASISPGKGNEY